MIKEVLQLAIPQIQLQIQDIQMNYSIRPPQVNISQPEAQVSISQPAAILDITAEMGKLSIDQSQAFSEAGLKPISEVNRDYVQKGKQAVLAAIAKKAQQGEQLMHGAGKGQRGAPIAQVAKQNAAVQPPKKINIDFIPSPGAVKMDYTPGEFDIHIEAQKPKIDVQVNKPKIDLTYGDVTGTMTQRPSVEVHV